MGKQAVNKIEPLEERELDFLAVSSGITREIEVIKKLNEVITTLNDLRSVVSKITSVKE